MGVIFDEAKRQQNLLKHGLDLADADQVFKGPKFTLEDDRRDYSEPRFRTYGLLGGRLVFVAWTLREDDFRVIMMRKCNEREQEAFTARLG